MKNNTTIHTTLNIKYMWARTGIDFMKLCSCQGTLNPDFHHNPVTSEPKNKTVDGVRRIHENTGLKIIWGLDSKATTGNTSTL